MNFNRKLPGETIYDRAYTREEQTESAETTEASAVYSGNAENKGSNEKNPDFKRKLAIASLVLGISSFLLIFVMPIFGLVLSAVAGVFGIVLGAVSRKAYAGLSWTGIIFSIIALVLVLLGFIVLCVVGWGLVAAFFSQISQYGGYSGFQGLPNGFYY